MHRERGGRNEKHKVQAYNLPMARNDERSMRRERSNENHECVVTGAYYILGGKSIIKRR